MTIVLGLRGHKKVIVVGHKKVIVVNCDEVINKRFTRHSFLLFYYTLSTNTFGSCKPFHYNEVIVLSSPGDDTRVVTRPVVSSLSLLSSVEVGGSRGQDGLLRSFVCTSVLS